MPYLIAHDLVIIALVVPMVIHLGQYWDPQYTESEWMHWTNIFFGYTIYSLFSLPFLLLAVPLLASIATHAQPTGYDKSGVLCPMLSAAQIQKMRARRRSQEVSPPRRTPPTHAVESMALLSSAPCSTS